MDKKRRKKKKHYYYSSSSSSEINRSRRRLELVLFIICCCCCVQPHHTRSTVVDGDEDGNNRGRASHSHFYNYTFPLSILLGLITGFICALAFALFLRCFIRYINTTPILKGPVVFSPNISPTSLQSALFHSHPIPLGGNYFTLLLDNGLALALKTPFRLQQPTHPNTNNYKLLNTNTQHHLHLLATLSHPNLMTLRAYVRQSHTFSLLYDYIPTGSLEDAMAKVRDNNLHLSWDLRLRIAVGIIKGLHYLHFVSVPRIMHYNLKPSNIMLDAEFEPRMTDCGLAKLLLNVDSPASSCYNAPECFHNCRYSDKSDIFSFGVILGVLLTGRDPMDPFFGETSSGGSLGRWLHHVQEAGEAKEALDKSIVGEEVEEDEMLMAMRIAVVCLSDLPADRPSSDELVPMLTQLHSF